MVAFNEAHKKVEERVAEDHGRHARRYGIAPRHVLKMPDFAEPLARLITEIKRLPGIGQKSAQRVAFHVLRSKREDVDRLAQALLDVKDKLGICSVCNNISDGDVCSYCRDISRDQSDDLRGGRAAQHLPIETTRQFHGLYHVLHGAISPLRGIGPEQLRIKSLLHRMENGRSAGSDPRHESHRRGRGDCRLICPGF